MSLANKTFALLELVLSMNFECIKKVAQTANGQTQLTKYWTASIVVCSNYTYLG